MLDRLALTESAAGAANAVRIALANRLPEDELRRFAAKLAQGQRAEVLRSLLADLPEGDLETELGACLLHEMIVRGKSVTTVADVWTRRLAGHPLADLPLYPLPGEADLPVTDYHLEGEVTEQPFGPGKENPLTLAGTVPVAERQNTPPDMTAAVTRWVTESAGKAEAALFTLASPLDPDDLGIRTIEALGLDSVAGGGLALLRADLDDAVAMLFGAAANGTAYDRGFGGAYGRAAAWRSVHALAGGTPEGCAWWTFDAANDWFYRIAWDLGVVCLRPGGHVLTVLAATDND